MTVALVGAGPGDPGLITVRGLERLRACDAVVYDRLVAAELVDEAPDDALRVSRDGIAQEQINELLVVLGRQGLDVVRLKGGDPYLFGRGGEEVQACAARGIPVDVVPGVSSALAAPAAAGIPLTHRGVVGAAHIAHGHGTLAEAAVRAVVEGSATLVVLMGVALLAQHVEQLLAAGADPDTPVAVVENATLPAQRVTRAPLLGIVDAAEGAGVAAPAVVVVGAVAAPGLLEES